MGRLGGFSSGFAWAHSHDCIELQLAGLKSLSRRHLHVLQLTLAVGLGDFSISFHSLLTFTGLDQLPCPMEISEYQVGKGRSCKASVSRPRL